MRFVHGIHYHETQRSPSYVNVVLPRDTVRIYRFIEGTTSIHYFTFTVYLTSSDGIRKIRKINNDEDNLFTK